MTVTDYLRREELCLANAVPTAAVSYTHLASIVILLWFVAKILHDNLVGYQFAVTNTKMFSIVPYIVQTIAVFRCV